MTARQPKAKLLYGQISGPTNRRHMEQEISALLAQGYHVAAMTQGEDGGDSWLTVLLAKASGTQAS